MQSTMKELEGFAINNNNKNSLSFIEGITQIWSSIEDNTIGELGTN
jgi:hypothetical protein